MRKIITSIGAAAALLAGTPLAAEVTDESEAGFVTRDEAVVDATPKEVWLALITPSTWWNSAHTWSADSSNLTLTPQAGGCFCETIPEAEDAGRITLEGSVEHMRVIQAYPESALRMTGALGPLQSEPVTGILTIALSEVDAGTRIVWEYNVGGKMRFETPVIARAVDGVMSEQLNGLANLLGRVGGAAAAPDADTDAEGEGDADESPENDEPANEEPESEETPSSDADG
ncbi:SRPBCC family protein [Erythrobacter rubeus]|uniref:SRPBCC family protein n=1 Tax=Erythrobacter rubeus TaxID=2760803 RepID=A0ABR8KTI0_9SPHN|nr:SRPBCC family protein [Erythrobacter rubeus]MBD2841441.1 SRPBCC family protein [Erythrobacter rubeus]